MTPRLVVDASALIAILRQEKGARTFSEALQSATHPVISAANYVEAAVVIDGQKDPVASRRLDDLVRTARIEIAPISVHQAHLARETYKNFGRGSGHPAKLNFGDCFAYALAVTEAAPLLSKGEEFKKAGLKLAVDIP